MYILEKENTVQKKKKNVALDKRRKWVVPLVLVLTWESGFAPGCVILVYVENNETC